MFIWWSINQSAVCAIWAGNSSISIPKNWSTSHRMLNCDTKSLPRDLCSTSRIPLHRRSINPPWPSDFLTGCSKVATRRRGTPNTVKKASQNDFASASSDDSFAHSWENFRARSLISFHDKGMR